LCEGFQGVVDIHQNAGGKCVGRGVHCCGGQG
jgi:hypothetical protein